jgi:hypothetical protein
MAVRQLGLRITYYRAFHMRHDMHKVIVERPRRGSRGPFRRAAGEKNASADDLPGKQGMRRRYLRGELRELNENLAPLRRYLRKQVGRPWNAVYSEISQRLRSSSAVQQHVRDHIWDYVERNVTIGSDGLAYYAPGFLTRQLPLRIGDMFIHPDTGLLTVVKKGRSRPRLKR